MRGNRRDTNQTSIVEALRGAGYWVAITADIKHGFPDLIVASKGHPPLFKLMEIKVPGEHLTEDELIFFANCPGDKEIITSPEMALASMCLLDELEVG
jgi:hypothetical protein